MKVNIGPYLNWWGPYQILGLLQYLGFSEDTTNRWAEKSPEWFTDLCQWIYDKRKRKIKVKLHRYDTWSMDTTLAYIILPMLEQIKRGKCGTPIGMFEDGDGLTEDGNPDEVAHAKAIERWDLVIDRMIWSFKQIIDEEYEVFQTIEEEINWEENQTNWPAFYAYHEHIQEGLELFGKHYQSLWS